MKRLMVVFLCLTLATLGVIPAIAQGLPDLIEQSSLPILLSPLPDPAICLGQTGELFQANFHYENGVIYDTYLYAKPADQNAFITAYTEATEQAGYSVSQGEEDGNAALYISSPAGKNPAILLTAYQGYMFLMVPVGDIDFVPETKVEPNSSSKTNYLRMEYNGRTLEGFPPMGESDNASYSNITKCYSISYSMTAPDTPFRQVFITWPANAAVGSNYTILARDESKNSWKNGIYFELDDDKLIAHDVVFKVFCGRGDYFSLTVTRIEETDLGRFIECSFDCELDTAGKNPIVIKDGVFSAYLP